MFFEFGLPMINDDGGGGGSVYEIPVETPPIAVFPNPLPPVEIPVTTTPPWANPSPVKEEVPYIPVWANPMPTKQNPLPADWNPPVQDSSGTIRTVAMGEPNPNTPRKFKTIRRNNDGAIKQNPVQETEAADGLIFGFEPKTLAIGGAAVAGLLCMMSNNKGK